MLAAQEEEIASMTSHLNSVSEALDSAGFDKVSQELVATTGQFRLLLEQINSGEGTAGKLIYSDTLYYHLENLISDLDSLIIDLNENFSWTVDSDDQISARKNIYSKINFYQKFKNEIINQIIDNYGKLRGFVFNHNNNLITIIFPPSQPENFDVITSNYPLTPISVILNEFKGDPTGITQDRQSITGLWYRIFDINYGIYFPIEPIKELPLNLTFLLQLPIGPPNPIFVKGLNIVNRLELLNKNIKIILQLILWLFILSKLNAKSFIEKYLVKIESDKDLDSVNMYDFSNINYQLPIVIKIDHAINYLSTNVPTLIVNGKIKAYSDKFYNRISFFLHDDEKNTKGLIRDIPTEIDNLFDKESDFIQHKNTAVFINENNMRTWVYNIQHKNYQNVDIKLKIDSSYALFNNPYLFKNEDEHIYIIQNVYRGELNRALNVAYQWYINKLNDGYFTESFDEIFQLPIYVVYGIHKALTLVPIEDKTNGVTPYLQILRYSQDHYAAMLPIL